MESENYRMFLISLCTTFASENKPIHIQRLAVIIFKNVLDSKERDTKVSFGYPLSPHQPNQSRQLKPRSG